MKSKWKKIASIVIFVVLFFVILTNVDKVMERKYSYQKYTDFYEQKEDFDVLFMGTSHVINAIYPMELWKEYGIVSYNMANHSENICTNYWQLKHALKYTKPKVVVVDLYAIDGDGKANETYLHNLTDTMPFSLTKIGLVTDLLPVEKWPEYLFELSIYHARWDDEDFSRNDFFPEGDCQKGAELRTEVCPNKAPELIDKSEFDITDRVNKQYLQKIIDLCKAEGIDVILTYLPYSAPLSHQYPANYGYYIAEKNDIEFINFLYEDVINYQTDCADEGSHLNVDGARNVSSYMGAYLQEKYGVKDHRQDIEYQYWNDDYREYADFKQRVLLSQSNIWSYMAMLYDQNLECTMYWTKDSALKNDQLFMEFIHNMDRIQNITYQEESAQDEQLMNKVKFDVKRKDTDVMIDQIIITLSESGEYLLERQEQ